MLDDGTVGGEVNKLLDDFALIMRERRQFRLCVNAHKCELITSDDEVVRRLQALAPEITHVTPSAATRNTIGAPISYG